MRSIRVNVPKEKTPFRNGFKPYAGSDWLALSKKAIQKMKEADLYNHEMISFFAKANKAPDANSSPIEVILQSFFGNQKDLKHAHKIFTT